MPPSEIIKDARRASGLTQAELAARIGSTQPAIARLERPESNPTVSTLRRVLDATGHDLALGMMPTRVNVDETLIEMNLRCTPAQRLERFGLVYESLREFAPSRQLLRGRPVG